VPGPLRDRHILNELASASDQHVRRHAQVRNFLKIRMVVRIQTIGEKCVNTVAAKLARRQGNAMDDNEFRIAASRPLVTIWRRYLPGFPEKSGPGVNAEHQSTLTPR